MAQGIERIPIIPLGSIGELAFSEKDPTLHVTGISFSREDFSTYTTGNLRNLIISAGGIIIQREEDSKPQDPIHPLANSVVSIWFNTPEDPKTELFLVNLADPNSP